MDDDQIRISETVDRSDPLTVDVVLEVHETIASVQEVDGFVRVRFRVPIAEWNAVLGRMPTAAGLAAGTTPAELLERLTFAMDQMRHCDSTRCLSALCWLEDGEHPSHSMRKSFPNYVCSSCGAVAGTDKASGPCSAA